MSFVGVTTDDRLAFGGLLLFLSQEYAARASGLMVTTMKCQISHFVRHIDEAQTRKYYDYFWCTVHQRVAKNPDFCLDVEEKELKNKTREEIESKVKYGLDD